jgi:hypothetical protein
MVPFVVFATMQQAKNDTSQTVPQRFILLSLALNSFLVLSSLLEPP